MVLQSTFFDPVIGLDMHIVGVPAPPAPLPVPTPIPIMFSGLVFDPLGLAVGAAIGMALGSGPGLVTVNLMPATNCGTEVWGLMGVPHIPVPGIIFMKTGAPVYTDNDAALYFGSMSTSLGGTLGVRLGDIALSCSDPVRMPTSVVLAIPKGMPVLNMNPPVPDLMAIAMAVGTRIGMNLLRRAFRAMSALARRGAALFRVFRESSPFFRRLSQILGGCTPPAGASRLRAAWSRFVRVVTGHPVDVVTGNLFTDAIDADLPGPIPFVFERVYESCSSARKTSLGYGWNHSYDESLWMERGRAVVRLGDNREVEFPLWDLPDRRMRVGDTLERVIHKMRLTCTGPGKYEVFFWDKQLIHEYAQVEGGKRDVARLVKVKSRDGLHAIELYYRRGMLDSIRDSAGRIIELERDTEGRLRFLKLPLPHGRGWYKHREYVYDRMGDLVQIKDAAQESWHFQYKSLVGGGHLMVRETDRAGLSFYFQYDGTGEISKCVRTWGDGGIYDHVIHYDVASKKTIVENSLGHATVYEYNVRGRVTKVLDAVGAVTEYEDDPDTGGTIKEVSPSGGVTQSKYDAFGMLTEVTNALGHTTRIEYDAHHQPSKAIDVRGGEWKWSYDGGGRLTDRTLPTGARVSFVWERGLLSKILDPRGQSTELVYDDRKQVTELVLPNGGRTKYEWDELGRVVKTKNAREGTARFQYDAEGRLLESYSMVETLQQHAYDPEGNLLEARDPNRHVKLGYEHFHRVAWREEDGTRLRFEYDTEDRVTAVVNEAGERYTFELDPAGRVVKETGFDGRAREYVRDIAGRPTLTVLPSGRTTTSKYDVMSRLLEAKHSDKTFAKFEYAVDGLLTRAENEASVVDMERDSLGRVVREVVNGRAVDSQYDASGNRTEMTSSLGARVVMSRDGLGQPREMYFGAVDGFKEADVRFDRDGLGLESRRAFKNGIEVEWSRDVAGRPTARRTFKRSLAAAAMGFAVGMLATPSFAQPQREEVDARVYQWRGEDQIAGIVDAASGPKFYDHDGRGRLVRERRPDVVVERAMDAVGNVYRSRTGTDRRYGPGGRLEMADGVRYEHDEDGNQTLKSGPDGDWRYRWNGHGMLREVERPDGIRVSFEYDPFARRTVKRTLDAAGTVEREVDFVWDGHNVVHELDSERGLISWQWEPESFTPIAKEHAGRRWTIASDHLGTPTEMYDDLGQLAWKMQLDVFGVPRFDAGTAEDCPWRWPGQYEDESTGLFYNRWRYYAAQLGSFSAQDPLGVEPSTRLMGYPTDPTTHVDPSGLTAEALRAAMEAERGSALGSAMTPHHIVEESASGWAERSRDLLARNGLHWDDAANGASLFGTHPNRVAASGMTRPQLRATGRYHAGVHLHRYGGNDEAQRMIYRILRGAERRGPAAVEAALRDIGRRMEAGTWRSSYAAAGGRC